MGTAGVFVCVFVGYLAVARAVILEDGVFLQYRPQLFENLFLFEENFDFPKYDTIFSSSRTRGPDFHMLGELPPIPGVPKVEVFCDDKQLTVLVGKRAGSVVLAADELQLGDRCYRNHDLPDRHVFAYSVDECGTSRVIENGVEVFTNTLWINRMQPQTWWPVPSLVRLSCVSKRLIPNPSIFVPMRPDEGVATTFNFRAMDASWTGPSSSNVYERGKAIRFQVSATTEPEQQLFIQSCFISASAEPRSRPRRTVVTNKGCAALLEASRPAVQFVASERPNVINFVLNTSLIIPQPFVHCTVRISDQRLTSGSKFCNYDVTHLRWEDLSGAREGCECCNSKCEGLSLQNVPDEGKALLSIGPFVVKNVETAPEPLPGAPDYDSMESDGSATVEGIVSDSMMSRNKFADTSGDAVVVVSQDPAATLALWLPGRLRDGLEQAGNSKELVEGSRTLTNDLLEVKNSVQKRESGRSQRNHFRETPIKIWLAELGFFGKNSDAEASPPLGRQSQEANMATPGGLGQRQDGPVIRSKLKFSKGMDGSQTLSYEEEVARKDEDYGSNDYGMKVPGRRGLRSTFMDLIRRLKVE